jgi:hypothetical protein
MASIERPAASGTSESSTQKIAMPPALTRKHLRKMCLSRKDGHARSRSWKSTRVLRMNSPNALRSLLPMAPWNRWPNEQGVLFGLPTHSSSWRTLSNTTLALAWRTSCLLTAFAENKKLKSLHLRVFQTASTRH